MLLDDRIVVHPKLVQAGPVASWLWVAAIAWCRLTLSNGIIPAAAVHQLAPRLGSKTLKHATDTCVRLGLFHARADGAFEVHDFLAHNHSAEQVLAMRQDAAIRKRRQRAKAQDSPEDVTPQSPNSHSDVPQGHTCDMGVTLPRARGYGIGTYVLGTSKNTSEGESEGGANGGVADDVWELWRQVATEAGTTIRLSPSPREYTTLVELAAAYSLSELRPLMSVFWRSPHVPGHGLGLFRSIVGEVQQHVQSGTPRAFRAPVSVREAEDAERRRRADAWMREQGVEP